MSEYIEMLEEIDMEYKELVLELGIKNWGWVFVFGCILMFIFDFVDVVVEVLFFVLVFVISKFDDIDFSMDLMYYFIKMLFGLILVFVLLLLLSLVFVFWSIMF